MTTKSAKAAARESRKRKWKPRTRFSSPKRSKVDEVAMAAAERHFAKADALVAGVGKLLTEHIGGGSWGPEMSLDVSIELLDEARGEREQARAQYKAAKA